MGTKTVFGLKRLEYKLSCITLPALPVYIVRFTLRESPCTRRSAHVSPSNIIYIMTGCVCTHTCTPSESQMNRVRRTGKMRKGNRDRVGPACVYIYVLISAELTVGGRGSHRRVSLTRYCSLRIRYASYTNRTSEKKNNASSEINEVYGAAMYIAHQR